MFVCLIDRPAEAQSRRLAAIPVNAAIAIVASIAPGVAEVVARPEEGGVALHVNKEVLMRTARKLASVLVLMAVVDLPTYVPMGR